VLSCNSLAGKAAKTAGNSTRIIPPRLPAGCRKEFLSAMLLHDAKANAKAQAGAFAHWLRRVEKDRKRAVGP